MYWVGVVTAGMTAFYVFRALFLCFFGEYRGDPHTHPHESPPSMWIPLASLAVLSLGGGYIDIPKFLAPIFGEPQEGEAWLMYVSVAMGLGGIALAALFYLASPAIPEALARTFSGPYRWIYNKYFVDEFYDATVVEPMIDGSRELLWRVADVRMIDGIVNGAGTTASAVGSLLRRAQSGYIRSYAGWVVGGAILVITYMGLKGGL
jgi:NADH-quinone oxidoreductase subunit L